MSCFKGVTSAFKSQKSHTQTHTLPFVLALLSLSSLMTIVERTNGKVYVKANDSLDHSALKSQGVESTPKMYQK